MRAIFPIIAFGRCFALLLIGVSVASCGPHFDFIGQWVGHRHLDAKSDTPDYVRYTLNEVKVIIFSNGHFDLLDGGLEKSGTVSVQGDEATLTITKIAGIGMEFQTPEIKNSIVPLDLKARPDGKVSYVDPKGMDPSEVILTRDATAAKVQP